MEAFNLQTRKLNVIEYLAVMQDEKVFEKIEKIITESKRTIQPAIKRLTKRELITRTEKSENDIRNNKVITQSQLEKESLLW